MFRQIRPGFAPGLVAATLFAWGCERPATPAGPKPSFSDGSGFCAAGERFTGGGRIDPLGGKTTFGFNVDASEKCSSAGRGRDRYGISLKESGRESDVVDLTGGNIQAH